MRAGSPVPQVYRLENPSLGCVLLAPKEEYNHFLREAAVFIYEWDSFADDTEPMAKGVIVDQVTAFELGEMAPALEGTPLGGNKLYTGGEAGNNAVIMMHEHEGIQGSRPIGNGLFVGGVSHAQELVGSGALPASDFKFFFNHCVWTRLGLRSARWCREGPGLTMRELEQAPAAGHGGHRRLDRRLDPEGADHAAGEQDGMALHSLVAGLAVAAILGR
uniref:Uncharacterized protein n=2 Tax=Pinguiococcus pyrenoidosus TaxID=172671 RepID=A0A7R9UID7_9STRA|mmetsp:Transcript_9621/g.36086  ORF Transcript_9621/g.36086 Transcript_9621/m.36086 type:complete len:218 (+) Transcript_9621:224-877(+)